MPIETYPPTKNDSDSPYGEEQFLRFKRSLVYAALLPLAFVTGLAAGFLVWGRQVAREPFVIASGENIPENLPAPIPQPDIGDPNTPVRLDVSVDDDPALGPEGAPVTIVEFSDFACGFCRRFYQQTLRPLLDEFPDQIRFVYRDFPVVGGFEAAQAAECADEQGEFWEFHNLLFDGGLGLDEAAYRDYANQLGLDADALIECVNEGRYASEVEDDARYAMSLGANGTPTFFINGLPVIGAQPLSEFIRIVKGELEL
ncbi:MAG: thioredoxin domain-containing protein [Anaerolineales bacterium]|nr:thioredoxin domain-containing protein [Anaerolineales bacterium]